MTTHDEDRLTLLEQGLRREARAVRDMAAPGLQSSILAALEAEPPRRANPRPLVLLAVAAGVAIISLVASRFLTGAAPTAAPEATADVAVASRPDPLARLSVASLSQPIAQPITWVEQPLRAELESLAADSEGLARTMLGGVPGPMRKLFGLPF